MRFKLIFDHSISVDDDEIPEDIIVKVDNNKSDFNARVEFGIDLLLERLNITDPQGNFPIEDVLCDGISILDQFNDKLFG